MRTTRPRSLLQRIVFVGALLLGIASLIAGGRVLFGLGAPGYHVVKPVLLFNTIMGAVYVLLAGVIYRSASHGRLGAVAVVSANVGVLAALVIHGMSGGDVAWQTLAAMCFRTVSWVGIYMALSVVLRQERISSAEPSSASETSGDRGIEARRP